MDKREWPANEDEISEKLEVPGPSEFSEIHGYPIDDEPEGDPSATENDVTPAE